MDLLNQLGDAEVQLKQYHALLGSFHGTCWTTDTELCLTGSFGPLAAELCRRHGNRIGRPLSEFFELAWGQSSPGYVSLAMQKRAAEGASVSYCCEFGGSRLMVFADPLKDGTGNVVGTVGVAIDVTRRETHT